jgi:hypothetical protein
MAAAAAGADLSPRRRPGDKVRHREDTIVACPAEILIVALALVVVRRRCLIVIDEAQSLLSDYDPDFLAIDLLLNRRR